MPFSIQPENLCILLNHSCQRIGPKCNELGNAHTSYKSNGDHIYLWKGKKDMKNNLT